MISERTYTLPTRPSAPHINCPKCGFDPGGAATLCTQCGASIAAVVPVWHQRWYRDHANGAAAAYITETVHETSLLELLAYAATCVGLSALFVAAVLDLIANG